jgi:hypothetical protein
MAWTDLASNQIPTEIDGDIKFGSKFGVIPTNRALTKDNANSRYSLDAGPLAPYAGNQLVPKSAFVGVASTVGTIYNNTGSLISWFGLTIRVNGVTVYSSGGSGSVAIGGTLNFTTTYASVVTGGTFTITFSNPSGVSTSTFAQFTQGPPTPKGAFVFNAGSYVATCVAPAEQYGIRIILSL